MWTCLAHQACRRTHAALTCSAVTATTFRVLVDGTAEQRTCNITYVSPPSTDLLPPTAHLPRTLCVSTTHCLAPSSRTPSRAQQPLAGLLASTHRRRAPAWRRAVSPFFLLRFIKQQLTYVIQCDVMQLGSAPERPPRSAHRSPTPPARHLSRPISRTVTG